MFGKRNELKPRKIERSDIDRLLFEILCFAAFSIVVRAGPLHIAGKFPAEDHISNNSYFRAYNQRLLEFFEKFLE